MDLDDIDDETLNNLMDQFEQKDAENNKTDSTLNTQKIEDPQPADLQILSQYFGHKTFRPLQWQIISAIVHKKKDVCAIMSTGYGKSLCFQYPALFLKGITLVISPLISLMEDQVLSLNLANIPACLLGTAQKKQSQVIANIFEKKYSLVYLSPEFSGGDLGKDILKKMSEELPVVLIAIDEAHCISSWGHDFRTHYRHLGMLRDIFPQVPMIAVTATATERVQDDIIKSLKLRNPLNVCTGFDRPNLYFEIRSKGSFGVFSDLKKIMVLEGSTWRFNGPTIIYCITRKDTEQITSILQNNGIQCLPYHAGLTMDARKEAHECFVKDKIDAVVATIAFGMGIDKPDIRNVIHYGSSKSIENYYQEVGRAGRDGQPSNCVTFYSNGDFFKLRQISSNTSGQGDSSIKDMENYFTSLKCRRKFILEHFGEKTDHLEKPRSACCDICTKKLSDGRTEHEKYEGIDESGRYDFTKDARILLGAISLSDKLGMGTHILFLRGSNSAKIPEYRRKHELYGIGKNKSDAWWQDIGKILIHEGYLAEKRVKGASFSYEAISVTAKGKTLLMNNEKLLLSPPSTILSKLKVKKPASNTWIATDVSIPSTSKTVLPKEAETQEEIEERMALYKQLLQARGDIAMKLDCMPYMIASNAALMQISKLKPRTLDDLRRFNLDGFSDVKIQKFGAMFLKVLGVDLLQQTQQQALSLSNIIQKHPIEKVVLNGSAEVSYSLFQKGLTINQIVEKREFSLGTITTHLITAMKMGHPIKLKDLGIDKTTVKSIVKNYRLVCKSGFQPVRLTQLKDICLPEITFDQIKAVLAYLEVRYHVKNLNVPFEDFEDFSLNDVEPEISPKKNSADEVLEESATKRFKADEDKKSEFSSILDSPPRESRGFAPQNNTVTEGPNGSQGFIQRNDTVKNENIKKIDQSKVQSSKAKILPPWLVVKKI